MLQRAAGRCSAASPPSCLCRQLPPGAILPSRAQCWALYLEAVQRRAACPARASPPVTWPHAVKLLLLAVIPVDSSFSISPISPFLLVRLTSMALSFLPQKEGVGGKAGGHRTGNKQMRLRHRLNPPKPPQGNRQGWKKYAITQLGQRMHGKAWHKRSRIGRKSSSRNDEFLSRQQKRWAHHKTRDKDGLAVCMLLSYSTPTPTDPPQMEGTSPFCHLGPLHSQHWYIHFGIRKAPIRHS